MNMRFERFHSITEREKTEKEESYEILSNPEVRQELKRRTERLIDSVHDQGVDSLVFLDRSARPISWLFRDLWKERFPDEKRPEIKFANIGTPSRLGHTGGGPAEVKSVKEGYEDDYEKQFQWMEQCRNIVNRGGSLALNDMMYDTGDWDKKGEVVDAAKKIFGKSFDGKEVLIVDDFFASGRTLTTALTVFSEAFDTAKEIKGTTLYSTSGDIEDDKRIMPWLRESGMAGILEGVGDKFLSMPINEKNIKKIKEPIQKRMQEALDTAKEGVEYFFEQAQGFGELIRQVDDFANDDQDVLEQRDPDYKYEIFNSYAYFNALHTIADVYQDFLNGKSIEGVVNRDFYEAWATLRELNSKLEEYGPKSSLVAGTVAGLIEDINESFRQYIRDQKLLELETWEVDELRKKTQTLRKELKELAHES